MSPSRLRAMILYDLFRTESTVSLRLNTRSKHITNGLLELKGQNLKYVLEKLEDTHTWVTWIPEIFHSTQSPTLTVNGFRPVSTSKAQLDTTWHRLIVELRWGLCDVEGLEYGSGCVGFLRDRDTTRNFDSNTESDIDVNCVLPLPSRWCSNTLKPYLLWPTVEVALWISINSLS